MTANDLKFLSYYFAKLYVVVVVVYCVYLWLFVQTYPASLRTAVALLAFAVMTLLPERFAKSHLAENLIMLFGVVGTSILLVVSLNHLS